MLKKHRLRPSIQDVQEQEAAIVCKCSLSKTFLTALARWWFQILYFLFSPLPGEGSSDRLLDRNTPDLSAQ